jgi:hypothetical protein
MLMAAAKKGKCLGKCGASCGHTTRLKKSIFFRYLWFKSTHTHRGNG